MRDRGNSMSDYSKDASVSRNNPGKELFKPVIVSFNEAEKMTRPSVHYWADVWRRLRMNKLAMTGLIIICLLVALAIVGPYLNKFTYYEQSLAEKNLPPNLVHWFGTDDLGRDLFTRAWYGARISLAIGFSSALIDFIVGVTYGAFSAIKGGVIDNIMMRTAEVLYSLPYMLIVILLSVILDSSNIWTMILALSITGWVPMARLVRGQVLQLKEMEYVQASRALGSKTGWVLKKHLIPNTMGPIFVNMTLTVPSAIFAEATLGFLGMGISAPMSSWGTLVNSALGGLLVGRIYPLLIPGLLISLTMFSFNVLGDGLRDSLDPRLRK